MGSGRNKIFSDTRHFNTGHWSQARFDERSHLSLKKPSSETQSTLNDRFFCTKSLITFINHAIDCLISVINWLIHWVK